MFAKVHFTRNHTKVIVSLPANLISHACIQFPLKGNVVIKGLLHNNNHFFSLISHFH